jgi:hypothetical protein
MKRSLSILIAALAGLMAIAPTFAQSGARVTFEASFPFVAGSVVMPAGSYSLIEEQNGHALLVPAQGGHSATIVLTRISGLNNAATRSTVSFVMREGKYHLDTVNMLDGSIVSVGLVR